MALKKKKTDREKLNKLVKKRTKTEQTLEKLKSKKRAPLKKIRTKIQEKKKKRIQKKINRNPEAIADRKNALKKKKLTQQEGPLPYTRIKNIIKKTVKNIKNTTDKNKKKNKRERDLSKPLSETPFLRIRKF